MVKIIFRETLADGKSKLCRGVAEVAEEEAVKLVEEGAAIYESAPAKPKKAKAEKTLKAEVKKDKEIK